MLYKTGKKTLSRNAANQHEELEEELYISKDGYMETFLVNETEEDVWYDNFRVLSSTALVVQENHYDPWGMVLKGLDYQYGGIKENKYLYNGKEKLEDLGVNVYDYGARFYDPAIGRFFTQDRFSEKYSSLTPYHYGGGNPINFYDVNGDSIVNVNQAEMAAIINDINIILQRKYGKDGLTIQLNEKSEEVRVNDWSITDPSSWGNIFEEAEYQNKTTQYYSASANEDFDWNADKYTQALKEVVTGDGKVLVDIIPDNGKRYQNSGIRTKNGLLGDYGGGFTLNSRKVILSNKLPLTNAKNQRNTWTLGGVALHELLYHIHTVGKTEGGNPNIMRNHFQIKTGNTHGAGSRQRY